MSENGFAGSRALRLHHLATDLGERYALERVRLSAYVCDYEPQAAVVKRLRRALGRLAGGALPLVWIGSVGTGKDHLMALALYVAADRGHRARWVAAAEYWRQLRDAMDTRQTEFAVVTPYATADVLGLSDPIPADGEAARWQREQLAALVDRRYRSGRPTWITANAASLDDFRERLGPPTADRLLEGAEVFECFWPSWRRREP